MRVMVTGHKGYIGSVLVPMLLERGHEVAGTDTDFYRGCGLGSHPGEVPDLGKDIRDLVAGDLAGFDAVIHLAALSNDPLSDYEPRLTHDINETASIRLAENAKQARLSRFIFASSCSVYGVGSQDLMTEESECAPLTPYARSKLNVEHALSRLRHAGFAPSVIRAGTVYGTSPRIRFDLVLNNLVAWAVATGRIHLKSDGSAWRPMVHVSDVARAYLAVLEADPAVVQGQIFNAGSTDQNYRIRELAAMVQQRLPDTSIEFAAGAPADQRNYRVSCDKIAAALESYRTTWTVAAGIAELHRFLSEREMDVNDFEGPACNRLQHLKRLVQDGKLTPAFRWT